MALLPPLRRRLRRQSGFTLVEVALAIGIVAFAFVALLALLPAGNTAFRRSVDIAVCGQIAQRVIGDAQETDFTTLIDQKVDPRFNADLTADPDNYSFRAPKRDTHTLRYFDDQGREVVPKGGGTTLTPQEKARVIYQVNTRIMPRFKLPTNPQATGIIVPPRKGLEPMAQITVQVAHNPGNLTLPFSSADAASTDPRRNLWVLDAKKSGIEIFTYSAVVGRAQ